MARSDDATCVLRPFERPEQLDPACREHTGEAGHDRGMVLLAGGEFLMGSEDRFAIRTTARGLCVRSR